MRALAVLAALLIASSTLIGCSPSTTTGSGGEAGKASGGLEGTWAVSQLATRTDTFHNAAVGRTSSADYTFSDGCDGSKSSTCQLDVRPQGGSAFTIPVTRSQDGYYTGTTEAPETCNTRDGSHTPIESGFLTKRSVKVGFVKDTKGLAGTLHVSSVPVGVATDASFGCIGEFVDYQLAGTSNGTPNEPSPDQDVTTPPPAPDPAAEQECSEGTEGQWSYHARVSDDDGLVLDMARLGVRLAVRAIQVPYLEIETTDAATYRVELTPAVADPAKPSAELEEFSCTPHEALARYAIQGLPGGLQMTVTQRYQFADLVAKDRCEPRGKIPCARFWPTVDWTATGSGSGTGLKSVRTVQRMDWWPDSIPGGKADVFRDGPPELSEHDHLAINRAPTETEVTLPAIDPQIPGCRTRGAGTSTNDLCPWDNYHHGPGEEIAKPGLFGSAACPSCVHFHWGWSTLTNTPKLGSRGFTSGHPAALPGSPQEASISVVKENLDRPEEDDPTSVGSLVSDHQSLSGGHPITYWETLSSGIQGSDGSLHDAAIPALTDNKKGDQGSFWFSPAVSTENFSKIPGPSYPEHDEQWAELQDTGKGWVLPVKISFKSVFDDDPASVRALCTGETGSGIEGPVYLQVGSTQELLNPEPAYRLVNTGTPYIQLRKDQLLPSGEIQTGDAVPRLCVNDEAVTTYLLFKDKPTPSDLNISILVAPSTKTLSIRDGLPAGLR